MHAVVGLRAGKPISPKAARRLCHKVATPLRDRQSRATPTPRICHAARPATRSHPRIGAYSCLRKKRRTRPPVQQREQWAESFAPLGIEGAGLARRRDDPDRGTEADEQVAVERPHVHVKPVIEPKLRHFQPGQAPIPPSVLFFHALLAIRSSPTPGITRPRRQYNSHSG